MKKILLLIILATFAINLPSMAQSMTDDQIISYILQEKEKGTDKQIIVRNLTQRGVTIEQLRRVQKKVEAEQKNLGAKDLTGRNQQRQGTNRLRTQREQTQDERQKRQNYMIRSQREEQEWRYMTREQRQQMIEEESNYFDLDSLDYYSSLIPKDQQVWGRNIFNQPNLSFEPNMNMATPANYHLGAGDVVIIDIWGASQESFESTISPDGTVTIEGVGPIKLGGLSVSEATSRLKAKLGQYYTDCSVSLSVGETRTIQVQVLGEVVMPGSYSISSLATAFNALYLAGGISDVGTLRDIKVYRSGKLLARIDVYDYLMNGTLAGNVRLQDNDVIIVGTYDCLVEVRGKVKRPMFYEMKPNESVQRVLAFAGGFTGDAYTKNVRLVRKAGQEYSIHTIEEFEMNGFTLADGDSLYVDSVIPRFSNMVEIRGAVMHPGMFQMNGKVQSVRELLLAAEGLREDAFTERAVMHREKEDLTLEMISVDIKGIMDGSVADVPLKKNDVLFIPSKTDLTGEQTLRINGEVNYPGTYQYAENTTIQDLILLAGGLTRAASTAKIDVFRRYYQPGAKSASKEIAQVYSFNLDHGFLVEDTLFALLPFDEVQVRKSPIYAEQQNVRITGSVNFEGEYAMTSKEFRLSDLVKMAGGLSELAYSKGARLIRQMTAEEREQQETSLRTSQIALYEQALESDKNYDRHLADSLLDLKMNIGYNYPVAINLEEALAHPGEPADVLLRANDQLIVPQFSNTVKISGEVMYPISVNYKEGKGLSYYIKNAGGYGNKAHKSKTYAIYMNGATNKLGRRAGKDEIQPGCEIVVPTKPKKEGMSTAEISVLGTSAASLTTMVVALINLLK
ncbi:MAG: SLBB domain-containing protein [Bacteroidaceae bacterium]|nr:SLBB domain-containing protein [Bacteroidaceae bacterium]